MSPRRSPAGLQRGLAGLRRSLTGLQRGLTKGAGRGRLLGRKEGCLGAEVARLLGGSSNSIFVAGAVSAFLRRRIDITWLDG